VAYRPIFWQIMPKYLVLIIVALVSFYLYSSQAIRKFNIEQTHHVLAEQSAMLNLLFKKEGLSAENINPLCVKLGEHSELRFTVILPDGVVIGDSQTEIALMDLHHKRPEIKGALNGQLSFSTRFSNTLQKELIYAARPVYKGADIVAVIRIATPVSMVDKTLSELLLKMLVAAIIVGLLSSWLSYYFSKRIGRPLEQMSKLANAYAQGDFSEKIDDIPLSSELAELAESLNKMGLEIDDKIKLIQQERNERDAVLSSMDEGVLAVDADARIITINKGAAKLLGLRRKKDRLQPLHEVVRNHHVLEMADALLDEAEVLKQEVVQHGVSDTHLRLHGTRLRDADDNSIGALIVIQDFTRLRKLEQMRSDFVANVSHELKTPITSIKGFVETLLDGAINQPEEADRFLKIVDKQAERLNLIIDDLLILSRIEQDYENKSLARNSIKLESLLNSVKELCAAGAGKKEIELAIEVEEGLAAQLNLQLMEQALVNLVNNGIKYSDNNTVILMKAYSEKRFCYIQIKDQGWGIGAEHLDRVFERFYRTDKARSRSMGGTGLGLAIVKHITQAHDGLVSVESAPGEGSTFTICLPLK